MCYRFDFLLTYVTREVSVPDVGFAQMKVNGAKIRRRPSPTRRLAEEPRRWLRDDEMVAFQTGSEFSGGSRSGSSGRTRVVAPGLRLDARSYFVGLPIEAVQFSRKENGWVVGRRAVNNKSSRVACETRSCPS